MKKVCSVTAIMTLFWLTSCNQQTPGKGEGAAPIKKGIDIKLGSLSMPKDPVCEMTLEEGAVGDTTFYEGKIYGFCSAECKADFLKNPQSYLVKK